MPGIIYGTAWKKERTAELVVRAVRTGFRGIDTAGQPKHYDEPQVGEALRRLAERGIDRDALFVQTKFTPPAGQDPGNLPYDPDARVEVQVAQSFRSSLVNLDTRHVDALILHAPLAPHQLMLRAWAAMEDIHHAGGARMLGLSNCYDPAVLKALYADSRVKPAVLQNRFCRDTGYDDELRRWCSGHGIVYQGFWALTANRHLLAGETVRRLARAHDRTAPQVFFRFLTQIGVVPLTGTSSAQHMIEDLGIFGFELGAAELEQVGRLLQRDR